MKIEYVFLNLFTTIAELKNLKSKIADDLANEILNTFIKNENLIVAMSAFLLTPDGSLFWTKCNSEKKEYLKKNGFKGISEFCIKSGLMINSEMKNIFDSHLLNGFNSKLEPIN